MNCKLILDDWRKLGEPDSIYNTPLGLALSCGDLHSGSSFNVVVDFVDQAIKSEIANAFKKHKAYPVFRLLPTGK